MSVENAEEKQAAVSQESAVCVGDGTTCVECGKVFTHPFYFSTHIGTHTNQRGFVVVGQCALCGLVFSSASVFAAHLNSSQTRLQTQVTPEDEDETVDDYSDSKSDLTSRSESGFAKNSSVAQNERVENKQIKGKSPALQSREATPKGKVTPAPTGTNESSLKRKRKAPQRFEVDSGPQLFQIPSDADPEVEAYLLSLKEMGLTVDPAAFSSHRGGKRRRKGSESGPGKGKGKGRQEIMWSVDPMDFSPDMQSPKKASPKYEYLDSDDSFEDDPEILPVSGKMTRGQRLQQRLERVSQSKEPGAAGSARKQSLAKDGTLIKEEPGTSVKDEADTSVEDDASTSVKDDANTSVEDEASALGKDEEGTLGKDETGTLIKDESGVNTVGVDNPPKTDVPKAKPNTHAATVNNPHRVNVPKTKLNTHAAAVKFTKQTPGPGVAVKKEMKSSPMSPAMRNLNRTPMTANFGGKNVVNRSLPQPSFNKFNTGRGTAVQHTVGRNNHNRTSMLPNINNSHVFQSHSAGNVRSVGQKAVKFPQGGRKGEASRFAGTLNVQKSNSLEDLKKNSRENVEQMLQSIGMMAVTSSAMIQGKIFTSQKEKCGEITFPPVRSASGSGVFRPSFPHRGFPNRPFRAPETMPLQNTLSYRGQSRFLPKQAAGRGQASSYAALANNHGKSRGRQAVSSHTFKGGSITGEFSYPQGGGFVRGSGVQRGRGLHQQNNVRGAVKGANVAIRGKPRPVTSPAPSLVAGRASSVHKPNKPGGDVIVIDDDDLQNALGESSGIKLKGKLSDVSHSHVNTGMVNILDVDLDGEVSNIEVIEDRSQGPSPAATIVTMGEEENLAHLPDHEMVQPEVESELEIDESVSIKKREDPPTDEACGSQATNKVGTSNSAKEEIDVLPEEDIAGWKVCLAENSDSNEDLPSPPNNVTETSSRVKDLPPHDKTVQGSPSVEVKKLHYDSKRDDSSHQDSCGEAENIKQAHSESGPLAPCVSAEVCVLQDSSVCSDPADKVGCLRQSHDDDAEAREDQVLSTPPNPIINEQDTVNPGNKQQPVPTSHGSVNIECHSVSPHLKPPNCNERSSAKGNRAGCVNTISEDNNDGQQVFAVDMENDSTDDIADVTDLPVQPDLTKFRSPLCLDGTAMENQEPVGSHSLLHGSLVKSDDLNIKSDADVSIEEYPTQMEGAAQETCKKNKSAERKQGATFVLNNDLIEDSQKKPDPSISGSGKETLETSNGELLQVTKTLSSTPSADCNDVLITESEELLNGGVPSESSTLQAAAPGNFLKDVSSLLDIFTEIEKTCKEMEETQSVEGENQTSAAEQDVKSVPSIKAAESYQVLSSSKDETRENASGDCKDSELLCVKEVVEERSEASINEDIEKNEGIESECSNDNCGNKNDIQKSTIECEHSVTASYPETRQTSEEG